MIMTKSVFFVWSARSFFKRMIKNSELRAEFITQNDSFYKDTSFKRSLLSKIVRLKIFNWVGLIQVIRSSGKECDLYGSFNRFLKVDKPYFILLEQPSALYHYTIGRNTSYWGKRVIKKHLNDSNLKAIICRSNACFTTFEKLCGDVPVHCRKKLIYSYVSTNKHATVKKLSERCDNPVFSLLFIAQGSRFVSKSGLETIEAFKRLKEKYPNVELTILTSVSLIHKNIISDIKSIDGVTLLDFTLSYSQLEELYVNSTLLLHPTSDDSNSLTVLEAMKAGLPIISTKLYAIPEMVKDGVNGFLTEPKYAFFDNNNLPNPQVWDNRKKTIYSTKLDENIINFICSKVELLLLDRELLLKMSLNSLRLANTPPFDESTIISEWNKILEEI